MSEFEKFLVKIRSGDYEEITFILLLIAIGSAYFSFAGMALDSTGFLDTAGASVFGVLSGCAIWLIWYVAFRVIPSLTERKYILMAWSILAAAMVMILTISSAFNATAFRGIQASELHIKHTIVRMQEGFAKVSATTRMLRGLVSDLNGNGDRYHNAGDEEFRSGPYSGSRGPGAIEGTMHTIGDRFRYSAKETQDFLNEADRITIKINVAFKEMRKIQKSEMPLEERQNKIMALADKVRDDIGTIDGRVMAGAIARSLESFPAEVDQRVTLSRKPSVAARQKQGLERLRGDIDDTTLPIIQYANDIANADPVVIEPFETITPSQAVMRYWRAFKPQWAAAIALDMSPLIALIFLTIALRTKSEKDLAEIDILNTPLGIVLRVQALEQLSRQAALDPQHAKALLDRSLGQQGDGGDEA